jgi:hypothetical protein
MKELQLSTKPISKQQYEVARCHKDFKFGNEIFNIHLMFSEDGAKTLAKSTDGYIEINNEDLMLSQKFDSCNEEHLQYHCFFEMEKLLFSANGKTTYVVFDTGILEDAAEIISYNSVKEPEYPTISNPFEYTFELFKNLIIKTEQDEFLVDHCIKLLNTEEKIIIAETYPDLFVHYLNRIEMMIPFECDFDLTLSYLESYNKINSNEIQDYLDSLTERLEPSYSNDEIDYYTNFINIISEYFPNKDLSDNIRRIHKTYTLDNEKIEYYSNCVNALKEEIPRICEKLFQKNLAIWCDHKDFISMLKNIENEKSSSEMIKSLFNGVEINDFEIAYYENCMDLITKRFPQVDISDFLDCLLHFDKKQIEEYTECGKIIKEKLLDNELDDFYYNLTRYCDEQGLVNDSKQNIIAIKTRFPEYFEQYQLRKLERSKRKQQSNQERKDEDTFRVINDGIVVSINPLNEIQTKIYNDSQISDSESKLLFGLDGIKIYRKCSDEWVQIPHILSNPISYAQQRIQILFEYQDYKLKFSPDGNNSYAFSKERKIVKIIEKTEAIKRGLGMNKYFDCGNGYVFIEIDKTNEYYNDLKEFVEEIDSF